MVRSPHDTEARSSGTQGSAGRKEQSERVTVERATGRTRQPGDRGDQRRVLHRNYPQRGEDSSAERALDGPHGDAQRDAGGAGWLGGSSTGRTARSWRSLSCTSPTWSSCDGGFAATGYLLSPGHRHIAPAGGPPYKSTRARKAGYRAALQEAGVAPDPNPEKPPTATFAGIDLRALDVYRALCEEGPRESDGASVVGFDGRPPAGRLIPAVTTVRQMERSQPQCYAGSSPAKPWRAPASSLQSPLSCANPPSRRAPDGGTEGPALTIPAAPPPRKVRGEASRPARHRSAGPGPLPPIPRRWSLRRG